MKTDTNTYSRRRLDDVWIPEAFHPRFWAEVAESGCGLQVKTLIFTAEAVKARMPVGNHLHPVESNRFEVFVAAMGGEGGDLFEFRYALPEQPILATYLMGGVTRW